MKVQVHNPVPLDIAELPTISSGPVVCASFRQDDDRTPVEVFSDDPKALFILSDYFLEAAHRLQALIDYREAECPAP